MAETLPILLIFDEVAALFAAESTTASLVFGRREIAKQTNQGLGRANRVVFAPEDELGEYGSARAPGRNPRPLATLAERVTVYVHAVDTSALNDERAQYTACRLLHDAVVRAILLASKTKAIADVPVKLGKPRWVGDNVERQFGAELAFTLEVMCSIPDQAFPTITPVATITGEIDPLGDGVVTEDI